MTAKTVRYSYQYRLEDDGKFWSEAEAIKRIENPLWLKYESKERIRKAADFIGKRWPVN